MSFFPIPSMILRQLYTNNSLKNTDGGVQFAIKNRLSDAEFGELTGLKIDGRDVPLDKISVDLGDGNFVPAAAVRDVSFPLRKILNVKADIGNLERGKYKIGIAFKAKPFGALNFEVEDAIAATETLEVRIPRDESDDYSLKAIQARQKFVEDYAKVKLQHIKNYSFDAHILRAWRRFR
jgi:hydroxymethylglutaryl-CoA reductase (NADPH)